jgi:hypothetical protein
MHAKTGNQKDWIEYSFLRLLLVLSTFLGCATAFAGTSGVTGSPPALGTTPAPGFNNSINSVGTSPGVLGEPAVTVPQQPGIAGFNNTPNPPTPNAFGADNGNITSYSNNSPALTSPANTVGTESSTTGFGNASGLTGPQALPGPGAAGPDHTY